MKTFGFLLGVLLVPVVGAAGTDSGDKPTNVRAELTRLLIEDAKLAAPVKPAPAPTGAKSAIQADLPAPAGAPDLTTLWMHFTDTGILTSAHGKTITRELTFGPCTDGELLNQRFFW